MAEDSLFSCFLCLQLQLLSGSFLGSSIAGSCSLPMCCSSHTEMKKWDSHFHSQRQKYLTFSSCHPAGTSAVHWYSFPAPWVVAALSLRQVASFGYWTWGAWMCAGGRVGTACAGDVVVLFPACQDRLSTDRLIFISSFNTWTLPPLCP